MRAMGTHDSIIVMRGEKKYLISFAMIYGYIIKVCRWFLLNNKIFTFHDLFTLTESIDKQQPLFNLLQ